VSKAKTKTPLRIAAFDPGERTGWGLAERADNFDAKTGEGLTILEQGVWTVREVGHGLQALLQRAGVAVYETWRLYESHALVMIGNDMQPSQVVGMIRYEAWKQGLKIRNNGADIKAQARKTMPEWLVKHMAKSSEQHDQDAIMHLWYYVWREFYVGNS